jgi:hypothetical protein
MPSYEESRILNEVKTDGIMDEISNNINVINGENNKKDELNEWENAINSILNNNNYDEDTKERAGEILDFIDGLRMDIENGIQGGRRRRRAKKSKTRKGKSRKSKSRKSKSRKSKSRKSKSRKSKSRKHRK